MLVQGLVIKLEEMRAKTLVILYTLFIHIKCERKKRLNEIFFFIFIRHVMKLY